MWPDFSLRVFWHEHDQLETMSWMQKLSRQHVLHHIKCITGITHPDFCSVKQLLIQASTLGLISFCSLIVPSENFTETRRRRFSVNLSDWVAEFTEKNIHALLTEVFEI